MLVPFGAIGRTFGLDPRGLPMVFVRLLGWWAAPTTAMKTASARKRKPSYNTRIAVKNLSKLEPRLLSACLLALLICICVAKLLSVLSSQVLSKTSSDAHREERFCLAPRLKGLVLGVRW